MQHDYDEVPYPSLSYAQTHPDRLATIATLLGLPAAPVTGCRVLELGCAGGGNLLPMASTLPHSEFVGLDYSQAQVDMGNTMLARLGLPNARLLRMDILDISPSLGQFDYIIAHGVYSWVPATVREKVMQVCAQNLAPNGIAYISFNSYPGWHMMGIIRDAMLYRTRNTSNPAERATQARELLDFMADAIPADNTAFGAFLKSYVQFLQGELKGVNARGNAFLLHDELEDVNDPVYFSQFVDHATRHGLQYVAEADFADVFPKGFSPQVMQTLQNLSHDIVELEQYLDILRTRMFRQTLLCHAGRNVQRTLAAHRVGGLLAASRARPVSESPDVERVSVEQFRGQDGGTISTDHPVSKAALLHLTEVWPRAIPFDRLLATARARVNASPDRLAQDALDLQINLIKAYTYSNQLVELHTYMPPAVVTLSAKPVASAIARLEAEDGGIVTNLWHERVHLSPLNRLLCRLLDGTRDRAALLDDLARTVGSGELVVEQDGNPISDARLVQAQLERELEPNLRWLARAAMLVG